MPDDVIVSTLGCQKLEKKTGVCVISESNVKTMDELKNVYINQRKGFICMCIEQCFCSFIIVLQIILAILSKVLRGMKKYNIYCQPGWDLGTVYGEGSYSHNVFHQFLIKLVINHSINQ